jgi:hypothetical protein
MYISTPSAPRQLMPTIEQQVTRAVTRHKLKRPWLLTTESPESYLMRKYFKSRDLDFSDQQLGRAEFVALNIAVKLAKIAFSRYADGLKAEADRPIPNANILGHDVDHNLFTGLVQRYALQLVKPGNQVAVSHDGGRVSLCVHVKDGKVTRKKKGGLPRLVVQE